MHSPNAANFEISRHRLLDLNCEICQGAKHELIGTLHRTVQIDKDLRVSAQEFHQSGSDPEGAESLCHRDPYFTFERLSQAAAAPDEALRRLFHSSGEREKILAIMRESDTIVMTREQDDVELSLQLFDALADGLAGHPQSLCCRTKAARPRDFEEHPDIIPVGPGYLREFGVLSFLSTVSRD
jgi:hypothetical protein